MTCHTIAASRSQHVIDSSLKRREILADSSILFPGSNRAFQGLESIQISSSSPDERDLERHTTKFHCPRMRKGDRALPFSFNKTPTQTKENLVTQHQNPERGRKVIDMQQISHIQI